MLILGITGQPAAGKDTIADYLVTKGFEKFSMSDVLREEMADLGLPLDRDTIRVFAERRKADLGNDYLCHKILKKISRNSVIPSIRSTSEVKTFKEKLKNDFKLITVESPIEKRFEWAKERQREGDNITFEKFKEQEEKEKNSSSGSR
ncbi:MAG TPA: AAA family ATPase [Candidatus Paceibacterota bacterium]